MTRRNTKTFILETETRKVTAEATGWRNGWPTKLSIMCDPSVTDEPLSESEAENILQWIATDVDAVCCDYSKPSKSVGLQLRWMRVWHARFMGQITTRLSERREVRGAT